MKYVSDSSCHATVQPPKLDLGLRVIAAAKPRGDYRKRGGSRQAGKRENFPRTALALTCFQWCCGLLIAATGRAIILSCSSRICAWRLSLFSVNSFVLSARRMFS